MEPTIPTPSSADNSLNQADGAEDKAGVHAREQVNFRSMLAGQQPSQVYLHDDDREKDDDPKKIEGLQQEDKPKAGPSSHFLTLPNLLASSTKTNQETVGDSTKVSTTGGKQSQPKKPHKSSLQNRLLHPAQHADKKVIGLKNYGVSKSTRELRKHEWLSSTQSVHSHPNIVFTEHETGGIPATIPATIPAPALYSEDAVVSPGQLTPKVFYPPLGPPPPRPPPVKPKSVEELEERARRKAVMNPFELLFLGNLAALKVMGFYLITLETFICCGLVS